MMDQATLNSVLIAVFAAVLGVITTWFWKSREHVLQKANALAAERVADRARITELEQKLALVNQAVVPISTAFQAILIKELTHFHTPEMDQLMEKIGPPNRLAPEEVDRLAVLLKERSKNMGPEIPDSERDAALILPAIIKRAQAEADVRAKADALNYGFVTMADRRHDDKTVVADPQPETIETPTAEASLAAIQENTAATADSLAVLNTRAATRLAKTATTEAKKAVDEKHAEEHAREDAGGKA